MKARILDPSVKVYSSTDANAVSIATLPAGSEIEFGGAKRRSGKLWVPIILSTGQQAFIPGETRIYVIQQGSLLQNNVNLYAEPSADALVKQQLVRNSKVSILQVIKAGGTQWVKVRDANGSEGYIAGDTRIRMSAQKTKALGVKNMRSGVMWVIAGLIILFSGEAPAAGSIYILFGYGAILFGAVYLISGFVQYRTAPA